MPDELASLATRIRVDEATGAMPTDADQGFLCQFPAGGKPYPDQVGELWQNCRVRTDRLGGQLGSDRFAQLSTQLTGIAVNLVGHDVEMPPNTLIIAVCWAVRLTRFVVTVAVAWR